MPTSLNNNNNNNKKYILLTVGGFRIVESFQQNVGVFINSVRFLITNILYFKTCVGAGLRRRDALTRLEDRRAIMPSVTEMRVAKSHCGVHKGG